MQDATLLAIPAFIGLMLLELVLGLSRRVRGYEIKDAAASLAMGIGNRIIYAVIGGGLIALQLWLYEHRLIDLGHAWWVWVLALVGYDLCYYWSHRLGHEVKRVWTRCVT